MNHMKNFLESENLTPGKSIQWFKGRVQEHVMFKKTFKVFCYRQSPGHILRNISEKKLAHVVSAISVISASKIALSCFQVLSTTKLCTTDFQNHLLPPNLQCHSALEEKLLWILVTLWIELLSFIEHLLSTRDYVKCFTNVIAPNSYNFAGQVVLLLF